MSKYAPWKSFEQDIVNRFKKAGWKQAKRNWDEQFEKKSGRDILNTEPYCIQCKYGKQPSLKKAWIEANTEKKKGEIPIGIARYRGESNTLVVMSIKDLMWMIEKTDV